MGVCWGGRQVRGYVDVEGRDDEDRQLAVKVTYPDTYDQGCSGAAVLTQGVSLRPDQAVNAAKEAGD